MLIATEVLTAVPDFMMNGKDLYTMSCTGFDVHYDKYDAWVSDNCMVAIWSIIIAMTFLPQTSLGKTSLCISGRILFISAIRNIKGHHLFGAIGITIGSDTKVSKY